MIGTWEFHFLTPRPQPSTARPLLVLGLAGAVAFTVDAALGSPFTLPIIAGAVIGPLLVQVTLPKEIRYLTHWAWTTAGLLFIGWFLSLAVTLRAEDQGREWVITVIILAFAVDTAAYAAGRLFGQRQLAPTISPRKTWEGAAVGVLAGAGAGAATKVGFGLDVALWEATLIGLLVGVFGQLGDLVESMLKRAHGSKDSGSLLPGHGGLLDRLDSLIPAICVIYFSLNFMGR